MRYLVLILILMTVSVSCGNNQGDDAIVTGNIKGLDNDTIFVCGSDGLFSGTDTIIAQKGKFKSRLTVDTLLQAWMVFGNGRRYPLFLNKKDNIKIKGDIDNIGGLKITGSEDNELLTTFMVKERSGDMIAEIDSFVKANPKSPAGIFLVQEYIANTPKPDIERMGNIIHSMDDGLRNWNVANTLSKISAEADRLKVNSVAPGFRLKTPDGETVSKVDYRGKFLLIHFWASWDKSSRLQNATYRKLAKEEAKSKDIEMLGVSLDADKDKWKAAIAEDSLDWKQVSDLAGWNDDAVVLYAVKTLPADVLIDKEGRLVDRNLFELDAIRDKLKELREKEKADNDKKKIKK